MENLIKRLQEEVGLTEDQAIKTIAVLKDFMDKEGVDIDWEKFFKGKYDTILKETQSLVSEMSKKVDSFSDKLSDKAEDIAIKAKRKVRDISKKVYDSLNEEKNV